MDNRYDLLKLLVGAFNIVYLLFYGTSYYSFCSGGWWKYMIMAVIILLGLLKWVSFIHRNENLWAFVITFFVMLPHDIRVSYIVACEYFYNINIFSRVLYGVVFCMSLLSAEEILIGVLTRIIWRNQEDVICIEEYYGKIKGKKNGK